MSAKTSDSSPSDIGALLFIGIEGAALTPGTRQLLREVRPGGVILFRRNVPSLPDLAALCADLKTACDPPPLLAIDEEGGRVTRLFPHVTGLPRAAEIAGADAGALREYWHRYGDLLRTLGLDINFAPVLDLCPHDAPNGIADRSFGTDPAVVIACASEVVKGLLEAGIMPTLKHFPGLGPTLMDSHHRLPSATREREEFESQDLAPWASLAPEAHAVMIAHGHYPFYSGADPLAATLSREVSTTLLRETIGFRGVAISDDLEMKAVADRVPWTELAPRVVQAGNDMLLICHKEEKVRISYDALRRKADSNPAFAKRCTGALERLATFRKACARLRRGGQPSVPSSPGLIEESRKALLQAVDRLPAPTA